MFYNFCQTAVSLRDVGNPRVYFALSHNLLLLDSPFVVMLVHFSSVDCMHLCVCVCVCVCVYIYIYIYIYKRYSKLFLTRPWGPIYLTV